jgi:septation ring formation regulator EzrA
MSNAEILLAINSSLLGIISLLFLLIGYFLKDLHKDFKQIMERVNTLHSELHTHTTMFDNLTKLFQRQIDNINERLKRFEKKERTTINPLLTKGTKATTKTSVSTKTKKSKPLI